MKKALAKLALSIALLSAFVFSVPALALDCSTCSGTSNLGTQQAIECGTSCASGNSQTPQQATTQVDNTIRTVINILSIFVGIAAVFMIIIGGLRYITSGGSTEKVTAAKNTILYAVIGLIIVALAQVIVRFVLTNVTHSNTIVKNNNSGSNSSTGVSQGAANSKH